MAVTLVVAAIGAWAVMTERVTYVVTDGVSMNPVYHQGDLVFVIKADSYRVGEIAAYHGSSPGQKVLHRIIRGDDVAGFTFKGDNNESTDLPKLTADKLIGRAALHVPKGGIWLSPLLGPSGLGMLGFLFVSGAAVTRTRREIPRGRRKKKVKAMSRQGGSWAMASAAIKLAGRLPPLLRAAAAVIVVVAVFGIGLAVLGWIHPVTEVKKATRGLEQSMTFTYTADVPRSAAYDGTTVISPDPIFRKLADRIDLRISYRGHPGKFDATAELTNGSGWHTTILLAPATSFSGGGHDAKVNLNLDALDERAAAAATAIGIQPGPVSIAVMARVVAAGQPTFSAPLRLSMTPLQLTLGSGNASLVVKDSGAGSAATRIMREIKPFGYSIMTAAQARSYAVLLLLFALVGACALFFVVRRDTPLRSRTEIERRYPNLLVPVEPMASPPGKPVVNVDNFPALVKLAERYGQMILTWSRPDADDFVVRDEGITYRYRIEFEDAPSLQNVERIDRPSTGSHRRKASNQAT